MRVRKISQQGKRTTFSTAQRNFTSAVSRSPRPDGPIVGGERSPSIKIRGRCVRGLRESGPAFVRALSNASGSALTPTAPAICTHVASRRVARAYVCALSPQTHRFNAGSGISIGDRYTRVISSAVGRTRRAPALANFRFVPSHAFPPPPSRALSFLRHLSLSRILSFQHLCRARDHFCPAPRHY